MLYVVQEFSCVFVVPILRVAVIDVCTVTRARSEAASVVAVLKVYVVYIYGCHEDWYAQDKERMGALLQQQAKKRKC